MNRRKFFKWLGVGIAGAAVAPSLATPMGPGCVATSCSCSGRSFWEGRCEYCQAHKLVCGCDRTKGCTCPVLSYADYSNFSQFALIASMDETVMQCAKELGEAAGRDIAALHASVFA